LQTRYPRDGQDTRGVGDCGKVIKDKADHYNIIYVGSTPNGGTIYYRLIDEYNGMRKGDSWLVDINEYNNSRDVNIKYIPGLGEEWNKDEMQTNIDQIKIFFAAISKESNDLTLNQIIKRVEGMIQKQLWVKMETRKYLLTSVANWNPLGRSLIHKVEDSNIKINGLV
jgi:hypothetical protein